MASYKLIRYVPSKTGVEYVAVETPLTSAEHVVRELQHLVDGSPTFIEMLAPNEDLLVLGLGGPLATVGFGTLEMQREGSQIGALGTPPITAPESVEFDACGTPSPVVREHLIGAPDAIEIARHFFETGELHPSFTWE